MHLAATQRPRSTAIWPSAVTFRAPARAVPYGNAWEHARPKASTGAVFRFAPFTRRNVRAATYGRPRVRALGSTVTIVRKTKLSESHGNIRA
ncbi:hypothetical protein EVAR_24377_1 [Eumeta japonica]|uniref:Uncharacterized protein n=1 Tax=Eumeta variegata TaxID=151549 RepID=A0A4C1Y919_EUMVA|nr:hypothetical protein EVAR_24377_1 [Eumeta japonica]